MTLDQIAESIVALVAEHGAPNSFQLHDIAGDTVSAVECLRLSQTLRIGMVMLNNRLATHGLTADYVVRGGRHAAAMIHVAREA